jgi:hypothetical protein
MQYSILDNDEQFTNLNFWLANFSFGILKEDDVKSNSKLNFDFFRRRLSYAVVAGVCAKIPRLPRRIACCTKTT